MKRRLAPFVLLAALTASTSAFAAGDMEQARAAYDRGLEAHKQGDMHKAAEEFALADALAPNAFALRAAIEAAIEADDPAIGAELIERSKREPMSASLAAKFKEAARKFKGRAGRIRVGCPKGSTCVAKVDNRPVEIDKVTWTQAGERTVDVTVDGSEQTKLVEVSTDQVAEYTPEKAPSAEAAKKDDESAAASASTSSTPAFLGGKGLPPIVFYAGAGLTLVLAGVTTYFGFDTSSKHGEFVNVGCERTNKQPCKDLKADGEGAQSRTNISLGLTLVSAAATTVIGAVFTNWQAPIVGVLPGGGIVGYSATF